MPSCKAVTVALVALSGLGANAGPCIPNSSHTLSLSAGSTTSYDQSSATSPTTTEASVTTSITLTSTSDVSISESSSVTEKLSTTESSSTDQSSATASSTVGESSTTVGSSTTESSTLAESSTTVETSATSTTVSEICPTGNLIQNPSFEELDPNGNGMTFSGLPWEVSGRDPGIKQGTSDFTVKYGSRMACASIAGLGGGITVKQTTQGLDPTKEYYLSYSGRVAVSSPGNLISCSISANAAGFPPSTQIVNTPDWIDYRTDRFKPVGDSIEVGIQCGGRNTSGRICVDEILLTRACEDS